MCRVASYVSATSSCRQLKGIARCADLRMATICLPQKKKRNRLTAISRWSEGLEAERCSAPLMFFWVLQDARGPPKDVLPITDQIVPVMQEGLTI